MSKQTDELQQTTITLNRISRNSYIAQIIGHVTRALIYSFIMTLLIGSVTPDTQIPTGFLFIFSLLLCALLDIPVKPSKIKSQHLKIYLMTNSEKILVSDSYKQVVREQQTIEWQKLARIASSNIISILLLSLIIFGSNHENRGALASILTKAISEDTSARLRVLKGEIDSRSKIEMELNPSKTHDIELTSDNLIMVRLNYSGYEKPVIRIIPRPIHKSEISSKDSEKLNFQMQKSGTRGSHLYESSFTVPQSSLVYLSTFSLTNPVASITVEKEPVPIVSLTTRARLIKIGRTKKSCH